MSRKRKFSHDPKIVSSGEALRFTRQKFTIIKNRKNKSPGIDTNNFFANNFA